MRVTDRAGERIGRVGGGVAGQSEQALHHVLDLIFFCVAVADHRLLHLQRRVFGDRSPARTAAQMAVPRAWPSASVDCGLTLTNTFSTATSPGPCSAMISPSPSRITFRRVARSPPPDFTQPLVT